MEAKNKLGDYHSKLARDMHNFYHGGGNVFNAYVENNHGNGNYTPKRYNGFGNFSSYGKFYGHASYDDYGGYDRDNAKYADCEHSPYDCYEQYHHSYGRKDKQFFKPPQRVAKVEIKKRSTIEEFSKVNELPQATIEVEESVVLHVKEEITNVEYCDLMRDKNTEKGSIKVKEEESVEENERLVERSCIFDSISTLSNESILLGLSFKELKLFLELNASYVIFVGNCMVNPFTCELAFDIDHMLKCSTPCAYLEKQLLVSIARIKPSFHDLELLHDNLFLDLLVANFSSSCASMWSKIHIFFGFSIESGYDERVHLFPWSYIVTFMKSLKESLLRIVIMFHISFMLLWKFLIGLVFPFNTCTLSVIDLNFLMMNKRF
ncbi:hypothetical protein M9H77_30173 [Catharanthus roseus]|uniref:Uncharacterized protein n=1 Tax=Catharanthus roseus TaxID=4058 RepID=A0ACB9ZXF3_CATRO|nr:hypothetical protein M9H77_30173 [Catharanthus roseus]